MSDLRSPLEKKLDETIGPPLYYCSECLRGVKVTAIDGQEPLIERPCKDCDKAQIIAPRKAIVAGKGGMNMKDKAKLSYWQLAALLTGRCV